MSYGNEKRCLSYISLLHFVTILLPIRAFPPPHFHLKSNNLHSNPYSKSYLKTIHSDQDQIRGDKYGLHNNSTIPTPQQVAELVGVKPSLDASKQTWKRAWVLQKRALPFLHFSERFSRYKVVDSSLNLACLWWKALSGNDRLSLAYDDGLSFDLLPKFTRYIVHPKLVRRYPRLHHANVEIRTVFLDASVKELIQFQSSHSSNVKLQFRLISMGAGYDIRSVKLLTSGLIQQAYEIDLPEVVQAKQLLLQRLQKRRNHLTKEHFPTLMGVDLNHVQDLKQILLDILTSSTDEEENEDVIWHNIFLFEGVMIYLNDGIPSQLLHTCSSVMKEVSSSFQNDPNASLCLADRMENVPGGDETLGKVELSTNGWDLVTWLPKPGLARHMCSATLSTGSDS